MTATSEAASLIPHLPPYLREAISARTGTYSSLSWQDPYLSGGSHTQL